MRAGLFYEIFMMLAIVWGVIAAIPLSWFWFDAERFAIADTYPHKAAQIEFERSIKSDGILLEYSVVARRHGEVICDAKGGPFPYRADAVLPGDLNMFWWAPGDLRCSNIGTPGPVFVTTCWKSGPIWYIWPPKTECIEADYNVLPPPVQLQVTPENLGGAVRGLLLGR